MKLRNPFDLADILIFIGMGLIWAALYSQTRWVSFLVVGIILFCLGLLISIFKDKVEGE